LLRHLLLFFGWWIPMEWWLQTNSFYRNQNWSIECIGSHPIEPAGFGQSVSVRQALVLRLERHIRQWWAIFRCYKTIVSCWVFWNLVFLISPDRADILPRREEGEIQAKAGGVWCKTNMFLLLILLPKLFNQFHHRSVRNRLFGKVCVNGIAFVGCGLVLI